MKEEILSIASDLREGFMTTSEAKQQLSDLLKNESERFMPSNVLKSEIYNLIKKAEENNDFQLSTESLKILLDNN
jgi:hypothetical protein